MAEPRRRARRLRGAAVVAGLAVVAGSATQVVSTMSAPVAVRTATQNVSTANYYPAPLPTGLTCTTSGAAGFRKATLSWTAPPQPAGAAPYRYRVTWLLDNKELKHYFDTANTTTGEFRIRDHVSIGDATGESYRIHIRTINPDDPNVLSSGSVSWTVYTPTTPSTRCSGDAGFRVENQAWENQREWPPAATGTSGTAPRAGRMFISMADELDSGALADALPAPEDQGTLADVPPPAPTSDGSDSADAATPPDPDAEAGGASTPTAPGDPASPPPPPGDPADAARPVPSDPVAPAPSEPAAPAESTPAGPAAPTDPPQQTASLGAGPITVGGAQARLEVVDGQPEVIVSSGGVQVCTAAVPGATAIENSGGVLIVTGAGPDRVVDTETCGLS